MQQASDVRDTIREDFGRVRQELERLVRIPSVSAPGFDPGDVRASAEASAEVLTAAGARGVGLLELEGAHPAVFADMPGPAGSPTVLLYAHHDVQPPGAEELWDSPPFEPIERGGRLFGRGSADDKSGIVVHAAALRAHGGRPPIGVKLLIEGEEEIGSEHLDEFLERHGELLAADVVVVADSGNWKLGVPSITTSLRGLVDCVVEVRTLDHEVHSGLFGGPVPDALTCLARVLSTLHDDDGDVAIGGLATADTPEVEADEAEFRREAGTVEGVRMIGTGSITERLWARPAVSVLGVDAPSIQGSSNQLVPVARARVSLRLAPGQDPGAAMDALVAHLEGAAPWGASVRVRRGSSGKPFAVRAEGPAYDAARRAFRAAWDTDAVDIGMGGSIPLVAAFSETYPNASLLLVGVADPDCRAHGANESVDLDELERACVAETLLLSELAR